MTFTNQNICGLWISPEGETHLCLQGPNNTRITEKTPFHPFAWADNSFQNHPYATKLRGSGYLSQVLNFPNITEYNAFLDAKLPRESFEVISALEHQFLLQNQSRLFSNLRFSELKRLQLDIETAFSPNNFSNALNKNDRILAIGLRLGDEIHTLTLENDSPEAEKKMLTQLNTVLQDLDPDVIEGHNCFKFDLDYLRLRYKLHKLPLAWGRFNQLATFRKSRLRIAERWVDFPRCDIPGRTVFDTYLMIQIYDLTDREMESYSLKNIAIHLGISSPENRTYLTPNQIQESFYKDRTTFLAYLNDDLRETKEIAELLLPTYFAQVQNFPMSLQEACLRGTGGKVELLFLEKYYQAKHALPSRTSTQAFEGGFTKSFQEGVFKDILHFDVASLYPSLLLNINKNPKNDELGVFIKLLSELRSYRLDYKKKAQEATDPIFKREYDARQSSFKILINSFYGYLAFDGARFGDSELAAELTAKGRDLLISLIEKFESLGCIILEADTDGIYLSSPEFFKTPETLLAQITPIMPSGVNLEHAGSYSAMFCYKAKNYALAEDNKMIVKGSALRSRGTEPFLQQLTRQLLSYKLGLTPIAPEKLIQEWTHKITDGSIDIGLLAKSERLSQSPENYLKEIEKATKPRRASLEVALRISPSPHMGDKITYFITKGPKSTTPDWQRAHPIENYNPTTLPYDPTYYLKKITEWKKRYTEFNLD